LELSPLLVVINREAEYEISQIVNLKIDCRRAYKLLYKVIWLDYEIIKEESD